MAERPIEILILEDTPSDVELVKRELRKVGLDFNMHWVQDESNFRQALDRPHLDLVLTDYSLPGFNGMAALDLVRQRYEHVPVIMVSGAIGEELAIDALKAGATDYVLKQRLARLGPVVHRAIQEAEQLTARLRAEEQLRQQFEALRESEERLRLVIEGAKDYAIFMLDREGRVVTWNRGAEQIKGYTADEIIGRHFSCFYPPEDLASEKPSRELAITIERGQYTEEGCWRVRKDGSRFWASVTTMALLSPSGELRGFAKITRDMTERRQIEESLKAARCSAEQAKAVAEEASQAKDRFLAVLSHELRTPLTPVLAAVSLLQKNSLHDDKTRQGLDMIRRNVELEARLIDDLLDLTRIARGKVELHKQPVPLCTVIQRAVEVCKPDIEARKLDFGVDIGPDAPYLVEADAARLQQVFWNLIKNSIKFTPHGGCVGIRCRVDDGEVLAEVNDSGIGMAPETIPRIFNAFAQADRAITRQFGGLGLGLAISKSILELHGGRIEAYSQGNNMGATFIVRLPLLAWGPSAVPITVIAGQAVGTPLHMPHPLRLLVVEDHGDTAEMIRVILESEGHRVETAGDVAAALEAMSRQAFDMVISDLGLPDGTGLDLMRQMRTRGHTVPSIALSGYGQESDVKQSRAAGFAAHLVKPADLDRLTTEINKISSSQLLHS